MAHSQDPILECAFVLTRAEHYTAVDKTRLDTRAFAEAAVDVQVARLASAELHVRVREVQTAAELVALAGHP